MPSERAMEKAKKVLAEIAGRMSDVKTVDALSVIARALNTERAEVWEEAAKVVEAGIVGILNHGDTSWNVALRQAASMLRASAAEMQKEGKG